MTRTRPGRSVRKMRPSGAKASSHGASSPPAMVSTRSSTGPVGVGLGDGLGEGVGVGGVWPGVDRVATVAVGKGVVGAMVGDEVAVGEAKRGGVPTSCRIPMLHAESKNEAEERRKARRVVRVGRQGWRTRWGPMVTSPSVTRHRGSAVRSRSSAERRPLMRPRRDRTAGDGADRRSHVPVRRHLGRSCTPVPAVPRRRSPHRP